MSGPCRYWTQQGKCFYGNECNFVHDPSLAANKKEEKKREKSQSNTSSSESNNRQASLPKSAAISAVSKTVPESPNGKKGKQGKGKKLKKKTKEFVPSQAPPFPIEESVTPQDQQDQESPIPEVSDSSKEKKKKGKKKKDKSAKEFVPLATLPAQELVYQEGFEPEAGASVGEEKDEDDEQAGLATAFNPYAGHDGMGDAYLPGPEHDMSGMEQNMSGIEHEDMPEGVQGMEHMEHMDHVDDGSADPRAKYFDQITSEYTVPPQVIPVYRDTGSWFMSESHQADLVRKQRLRLLRLQPNDPLYATLPFSIHDQDYHSFFPLQPDPQPIFSQCPWQVQNFKVNRLSDHGTYQLVRYANCPIKSSLAKDAIRPWLKLQSMMSTDCHPNMIPLRDVFTSSQFQGSKPSLCFIYDYFPDCRTLSDKYFNQGGVPIAERTLWSYAIQICSALRAVHDAGLVLRSQLLNPNRIQLTGPNRIRISGVGLLDGLGAVQPVANEDELRVLQHQDLFALGELLLCLATADVHAMQHFRQSVDSVRTGFSRDLTRVLALLLGKPTGTPPSVSDLERLLAPRMISELQDCYSHHDYMENALSKEAQNGRLFRLLSKLNFVVDRPDFKGNQFWADEGDRHLLKLFRSYVFHQHRGDGSADVKLGHVIDCLNKLDVGLDEKVLLSSTSSRGAHHRGGVGSDTVLIVSYGDVKRLVEQSFEELLASHLANQTPTSRSMPRPRLAMHGGSVGASMESPGRFFSPADRSESSPRPPSKSPPDHSPPPSRSPPGSYGLLRPIPRDGHQPVRALPFGVAGGASEVALTGMLPRGLGLNYGSPEPLHSPPPHQFSPAQSP